MLETLRERLLSVQQDLTAGWVWPAAPGAGGVAGEARVPRPGRGRGGKQVTGGRGGVDWHRREEEEEIAQTGGTAGAGRSHGVPS